MSWPSRPLSIVLAGDYPKDARLGSAKVAAKLCEEFRALGHTCDVLGSSDIGERPRWRQVRQVIAPWMAARAIVQKTDRRCDVIDVASAEGLFIGLFDLLPDRDRPAYICRSHGLEHLNYARMLDDDQAGLRSKSWVRRLWYPATRLSQVAAAARLADAMIVLNEVDRRYAIDRGWQPSDAVTIVPHGVSSRFVADAPSADAPRGAGLLFCGTWDLMKGVSYLAAAINQLHARGNQVRLTVLGPGMPADVVHAAFDPPVRPFLSVIDRAPEDRVMEEYRRHDALLFTSTYEGFGLVVIEAMSQRLPVIATPQGCAATLVRAGDTGAVIAARDSAALASAVEHFYQHRDDARRMAERARDQIQTMTWRATAERTIRVYQDALARVRRPS